MITAENGRYILTDLSSNGIYVNGSLQVTSRHSRLVLKQGDTLRMGNYLVTVTELGESRTTAGGDAAGDQPDQSDPLDLEALSGKPNPAFRYPIVQAQGHLRGEDPFDRESLRASREMRADDDLFRSSIPSKAWQGAPQSDHAPVPAQAAPKLRVSHSGPRPKIDIDDLIGELLSTGAMRVPRQAAPQPASAASSDLPPTLPQPRIDPKTATPESNPMEESSVAFAPERVSIAVEVSAAHGALLAFLEGAGVSVERMDDRDPEMALRTAGKIFRAMAEGIREILLSRSAIKGEMGILQTVIQADGNNALKFSATAGDAVASLLAPARPGYMDPLAAAQEAFADIKQHELAVIVGVRSALDGLLRRFDPNTLEQRLSKDKLLDSVLPSARKARYWDVFRTIYGEISREAEDDFQSLFGRAFAKAYMAQTRKD
jgi:type VI secretion system FHA domain protein